jgi:hypothetical protein
MRELKARVLTLEAALRNILLETEDADPDEEDPLTFAVNALAYEALWGTRSAPLAQPAADRTSKLEAALTRIASMGRVCPEYETCRHPPCTDSSGAVLIALEALGDTVQSSPAQPKSEEP